MYNTHNSLFDHIDIEEVKRHVTAYLIRKSKTKSSPIERTETRGVYRLNPQYSLDKELTLNFLDEDEEQEEEPPTPPAFDDSIPDLFAGVY